MKGALKAIGTLVILMSMGNTVAEDQPTATSSGTTIVVAQQIAVPIPTPIPGNGPIGTTNWGGGNPLTPTPCSSC